MFDDSNSASPRDPDDLLGLKEASGLGHGVHTGGVRLLLVDVDRLLQEPSHGDGHDVLLDMHAVEVEPKHMLAFALRALDGRDLIHVCPHDLFDDGVEVAEGFVVELRKGTFMFPLSCEPHLEGVVCNRHRHCLHSFPISR